MAEFTCAANVCQERVLRDGETFGRQKGIVKGGKLPGYSAHLSTDARTKFRCKQSGKGFLSHRCNYTYFLKGARKRSQESGFRIQKGGKC